MSLTRRAFLKGLLSLAAVAAVLRPFSAHAGTVTKSIGSAGGRDYSTLQAWEDALPANLVTDGNSQVGECYNDSEFTAAGHILTIAGETTDSTHTITLTAASGQSFSDNASVQSNALAYSQSNGVGIRSTSGSYYQLITISTSNVFVSKLQFKTNVAAQIICINGGSIDRCIIDTGTSSGGFTSLLVTKLSNTLIVSRSTNGTVNTANGQAFNCTFVLISGSSARGILASYSSFSVTNCAFFGAFSNNFVVDHGTLTYTTCATDNAGWGTTGTGGTLTDGGGNLVSKTFANQFQSTTIDFRLKSGADCIDAGTTDTTNGTPDIAGTARPSGSAYDIGAWEFVAATAAARLRTFFGLGQ